MTVDERNFLSGFDLSQPFSSWRGIRVPTALERAHPPACLYTLAENKATYTVPLPFGEALDFAYRSSFRTAEQGIHLGCFGAFLEADLAFSCALARVGLGDSIARQILWAAICRLVNFLQRSNLGAERSRSQPAASTARYPR